MPIIGPRDAVLIDLAAAIARGGTQRAYFEVVQDAPNTGITTEDLIATLVAVAPIVGSARVTEAAMKLARAVGYDIDAALESPT